jgi:hypothetical protein
MKEVGAIRCHADQEGRNDGTSLAEWSRSVDGNDI